MNRPFIFNHFAVDTTSVVIVEGLYFQVVAGWIAPEVDSVMEINVHDIYQEAIWR